MDEHHIKLRGDPGDNRKDEKSAGGGISRTELENTVSDHAGSPGRCHIQEHDFTK
jgi:hypothetical protein